MGTDSLPALPIFVGFLLLFSYISLVQHSTMAATLSTWHGRRSRWLVAIFASLRHGCIVAVAVSGLAFLQTITGMGWWLLSFISLGLWVILVVIDRICAAVSPHRLAWTTTWIRVAVGARSFVMDGLDGSSENSAGEQNGNEVPIFEVSPGSDGPAITEEQLTGLDQRDRERLRSMLRFSVTAAREVMVPRLDMVAVEVGSTLLQVTTSMLEGGHSRLPVYEETSDRIIGIVHSRDVMGALAGRKEPASLKELLRPAFFIPETKRLDELLDELQDKGEQMAIVVDEYGGTEGLLTMEDLLEEIVGEIEDEFSRTRDSEIIDLGEGAVLVEAGIPTTEIEELFDIRIQVEGVDTVGGYVYHALGRIPQPGDVVTTGDVRLEVASILGRRLRKLRISRIDQEALTQNP